MQSLKTEQEPTVDLKPSLCGWIFCRRDAMIAQWNVGQLEAQLAVFCAAYFTIQSSRNNMRNQDRILMRYQRIEAQLRQTEANRSNSANKITICVFETALGYDLKRPSVTKYRPWNICDLFEKTLGQPKRLRSSCVIALRHGVGIANTTPVQHGTLEPRLHASLKRYCMSKILSYLYL